MTSTAAAEYTASAQLPLVAASTAVEIRNCRKGNPLCLGSFVYLPRTVGWLIDYVSQREPDVFALQNLCKLARQTKVITEPPEHLTDLVGVATIVSQLLLLHELHPRGIPKELHEMATRLCRWCTCVAEGVVDIAEVERTMARSGISRATN